MQSSRSAPQVQYLRCLAPTFFVLHPCTVRSQPVAPLSGQQRKSRVAEHDREELEAFSIAPGSGRRSRRGTEGPRELRSARTASDARRSDVSVHASAPPARRRAVPLVTLTCMFSPYGQAQTIGLCQIRQCHCGRATHQHDPWPVLSAHVKSLHAARPCEEPPKTRETPGQICYRETDRSLMSRENDSAAGRR